MYLKRAFQAIIFSQCLITSSSFATTGGGQNIELLGFDKKEKKLFLLRHFEDGRGRLQQLYYYKFDNTSKAPPLIEVKSLYINPKTHKIDYDQDSKRFDQEMDKIINRLTPLIKVENEQPRLHLLRQRTQEVPSWHEENETLTEYNFTYQVESNGLSSIPQQATAYLPELNIAQQYRIPTQNKMIVTIEYFGVPIETGYNLEDPVLLTPIKQMR